jgi:hypothetical protein
MKTLAVLLIALTTTAQATVIHFHGTINARKERRSVWILPTLVAPKTDLNLAHVVGQTVTQTEQNRECSAS